MNVVKRILAIKHVLLLDALLIALCAWMAMKIHRDWMATAAADEVSKIIAPSMAMKQAVEKQKSAEALQRNYMVISSRNLFSPDRNDQIPREEVNKPRPPKPILYGVINLTDAKLAMMSTPGSIALQSLKEGDKIGEYTLTKIQMNEVQLQWGSETVKATTAEQPKQIPAPTIPASAGSSASKVVSVNPAEGAATTSSAGTGNASPVQPPQGLGPCKGKWVKTLFGMVCSEDAK